MATKTIVVSDLTGKSIEDGKVAEIRVISHPLLDHAVKLDAAVSEVSKMQSSERELVHVELAIPGNPVETMVIDLAEFDKLIKSGDADDVLGNAERYYASEAPRRGRPRGSVNKTAGASTKRDPEQLNAIRTWARENGYEVSDRGRIKGEIEDAYEKAHKN